METTSPSINISSHFKGQILRSVYRVWLFRKLMPVLLLEIAAFSTVLYLLSRAVFVRRVLENALNVLFLNPTALFSFAVSAFVHAAVVTKLLTIGFMVLVALLVRLVTQGALRFILVKENYFERLK